MIKILKTPWKNEFLDLVASSKKSIQITSPFIKENICNEILAIKNKDTQLELITSFKLLNIYSGSLDLNGLENILNKNGIIKNFPKLHSKIYLFDNEKVIISSGNLTNGGLLSNYEYGVLISDLSIVEKVSTDYSILSNDENTGKIKLSDIETVRKILNNIPKKESLDLPSFEIKYEIETNDVIEIKGEIITSNLSGWRLEVFKCIETLPSQYFSLSEINRFENSLKNIFPNNNHILDKIRQQLQQLRDLGLIEFLGNGQYKKLWSEKRSI